ncbi:hypothetical protein [Acidipropionibacterium virtanenii]|uniref:Uncharacterized protein n=1 Tax=Acidipropionibacterium virtanenii TaxID=2057246 RepID=A0A344URA9_9ACTN|nr:hypothetical protein [Acidipropionibacterium virtanenii]AXE37807.1 hypothetical protein JS278_00615 [Acidipropionibacterium virtanenii]
MGSARQPLLFEASWAAEPPLLANPDVGVARLVTRGPSRSFTSDVTLLDSTDHRLLRAGVVLAHRVIDSMGEWYMDAPSWSPWLPVDCSIALDAAGELPRDFTCLVKPFLRGATLTPSAALSCDRREMRMLRGDGSPLADIRDDRISVVESGVTTSRAREVTITPRTKLSSTQRDWLVTRMIALGATEVEAFPSTLERLGPRAGAMSDVPRSVPPNVAATLEGFVSNRLIRCLRKVMEADLKARSDGMTLRSGSAAHPVEKSREPGVLPDNRLPDELLDLGGDPITAPRDGIHDDGRHGRIDKLLAAVAKLRVVLEGLSDLLEPRWVSDLTRRIDRVLVLDPDSITVHRLPESYYQFLDMLVTATRAPKLLGDGNVPARPVLAERIRTGVREVLERCDQLDPEIDHGWARARHAAESAASLVGTLQGAGGTRKLTGRLGKVARELGRTGSVNPGPTPEQISGFTPEEAFEAGRRLERDLDQQHEARAEFLEEWPERRRRIIKATKA